MNTKSIVLTILTISFVFGISIWVSKTLIKFRQQEFDQHLQQVFTESEDYFARNHIIQQMKQLSPKKESETIQTESFLREELLQAVNIQRHETREKNNSITWEMKLVLPLIQALRFLTNKELFTPPENNESVEYLHEAYLLERQNMFDQAEEAYNKCLALLPEKLSIHSEVLLHLGYCSAMQADYDKAVKYLQTIFQRPESHEIQDLAVYMINVLNTVIIQQKELEKEKWAPETAHVYAEALQESDKEETAISEIAKPAPEPVTEEVKTDIEKQVRFLDVTQEETENEQVQIVEINIQARSLNRQQEIENTSSRADIESAPPIRSNQIDTPTPGVEEKEIPTYDVSLKIETPLEVPKTNEFGPPDTEQSIKTPSTIYNNTYSKVIPLESPTETLADVPGPNTNSKPSTDLTLHEENTQLAKTRLEAIIAALKEEALFEARIKGTENYEREERIIPLGGKPDLKLLEEELELIQLFIETESGENVLR